MEVACRLNLFLSLMRHSTAAPYAPAIKNKIKIDEDPGLTP